MEITEVKVFPVNEEKLKAFVSVVFDRCFMVNDVKIIQGRDGLFISMPSRKKNNGEFKDIAHPLNNDTRRRIELQVVAEYERVLAERGEELPAPARAHQLGESETVKERTAPSPAKPRPTDSQAAATEAPEPRRSETRPEPQPAALAAAGSDGQVSSDGQNGDNGDRPNEARPEADPSLEEVQERHLRDSFWSVS